MIGKLKERLGDSCSAFVHCQQFTTMTFVNNSFGMYVPFL